MIKFMCAFAYLRVNPEMTIALELIHFTMTCEASEIAEKAKAYAQSWTEALGHNAVLMSIVYVDPASGD